MSENLFDQLGLSAPILRSLQNLGYNTPTPVQTSAIPPILKGRDLLGCSQTGTGKTAAFALPLLQNLSVSKQIPRSHSTRALVLTPTRELAIQISDSFNAYGRNLELKQLLVYGGVGMGLQIKGCTKGVDLLVATPGRLLDLITRGFMKLDKLEVLVLDEADRMLDMGFLPDIKRLLAMIPQKRQTLFFSATMPQAILKLAGGILNKPVKVQVAPESTPVERIEQRVHFVDQSGKSALLGEVLKDSAAKRVLVFTRTKHGANNVVRQLNKSQVGAQAIHGNKSQNARQAALANFRSGRTRVLVATDVASRGIDVSGVTHVINYDLPNEPECYVHRIGRTARAGAAGVAISFCSAHEKSYLRNIERLIRQAVPAENGAKAISGNKSSPSGAAKSKSRRPKRHRPRIAA